MTVTHGHSWLAAAEFATYANLPLHLILHDHWPETIFLPNFMRHWQHRTFGEHYRAAKSRLCVSPFMAEEYLKEYGQSGQILYPSRSRNTKTFADEPKTYSKESGPLIGAYAGNISTQEYARLVAAVAKALETIGGHFMIFGPQSASHSGKWA